MKRLLSLLFVVLWPLLVNAADIKCGANTTGSGVISQINDCVAGTPFAYGDVAQTTTVANSYLCPIDQTNCSLRQYRCDAETATLGNSAPVYSDQVACTTACNWIDTCTSSQFSKTLAGQGLGQICTDAYMTIAVRDVGGGTAYQLVMKDTSPGGTAHWNCEPLIVNQGGEFGQYTPPIVDGWHNVLGTGFQPSLPVDFSPYLPASSGWDAWNADILFCVRPVSILMCGHTDQPECNCDTNNDGTSDAYCGSEQCVYQADNAATFNNDWDPSPGSSIHSFLYRYSITVSNNDYTCPINPSSQCQGTAGTVTTSPTYYRVLKTAVTSSSFLSSVCTGICPVTYVDAASAPANTISIGTQTVPNSKQYHEFFVFLDHAFSPSASKTCMKQGICNPEPVCPTGYGCDCSSGAAPACPDNGTFVPNADNCQLQASSLCPAGFTYDASVKSCVEPPTCANGAFSSSSNLCETAVTATCVPGYAYNTTSQRCEYTMSCPSGTLWDNTLKFCRTAGTICPAGKTYNSSTGQCTEAATCQTGYSLNISSDKCEVAPSCLTGTAYNTGLDKCTVGSTGPPGTTLNTATDKYEAGVAWQCASGYIYNSTSGKCESAPPCGAGFTYSTSNNRCEKAATSSTTYSCPSGGTLSGTTCSYTATGTTTYSCPSGGTLSGTTCTVSGSYAATGTTTYSCPSGGTLSGTTCYTTSTYAATATVNQCKTVGTSCNTSLSNAYNLWAICPNNSAPSGGTLIATVCDNLQRRTTKAYQWTTYSCPSGGTLSGTTCTVSGSYAATATTTYSCPSGGTLTGTTCNTTSTYTATGTTTYSCSVGTLSGTTCSYAATGSTVYSCSTGTLSGTICWQSVSCASGGLLDTTTDKCQLSATTSCVTGTTYNSTTGKCEAAPTCIAGTGYNTGYDLCGVAATCPGGGTLDTTFDKCQLSPQCPTTGFTYSNSADLCQQAASGSCPTSAAYDPATGYCTSTLACPDGGIQDPNNALLCSLNPTISCPSGMAAGPVNGNTVTCQQPATCPASAFLSSLDATIGKCKITGTELCPVTWGFDSAGDVCTHVPVCNGSTYDPANNKCCICASANGCIATAANPTVNDYSCSPNTCIDITAPSNSVNTAIDTSLNPTNDLGFNPTTGGCAGTVYIFSGQAKTCRPGGWYTGGQDCCNVPGLDSALTTGGSAAVAYMSGGYALIAVMAYQYLISSYFSCNNDMPADNATIKPFCHYIGEFCSTSWVGVGCVQTTRSYCCYETKLARIIHEQGRPQLKRFQQAYCPPPYNCTDPNIFYNTPEIPDCSGIRPEEFSFIDFSKIDMSEFISDLQGQISGIVSNTQNNVSTNVQQYFQNLKK